MVNTTPISFGGHRVGRSNELLKENEKEKDVRMSNIKQAKSVADAVRTSLGPKGMDKMIVDENGNVTVTNDGATIMKLMQVMHPAANMLVDISHAQDIEAGDGTTSVVVLTGALLDAAYGLLERGIHSSQISTGFQYCRDKAIEYLKNMAIPVDLGNQEVLLKNAKTSLNSKIVSQYSDHLAPLAVEAVTSIIDPALGENVDLNYIRIVKKVGGSVEDTNLVQGLVFSSESIDGVAATRVATGPARVENANIGLIQFALSSPKTNMDGNIVISDADAMKRLVDEERRYILKMVKTIKKSGCNVLLVQKNVLREGVSDLALHYLSKVKILVIKDVERKDIDFITRTTGALPIASIDHFSSEKLGFARLVQQRSLDGGKLVEITGCEGPRVEGHTCTISVHGASEYIVDEVERSIHDALCVIRALVKEKALLPGGGSPEIELSHLLYQHSREVSGVNSLCLRAFSEALEIIPTTLAENAGLNPVETITKLRAAHTNGMVYGGLNCDDGEVVDMRELDVVQPLLVNTSSLTLATECVRMLMKIDDIVGTL
eukprot:TRINITY_DN3161_c0_g1_i1.p1 TRINITY_DN3161_c0_g1~~TRINITY_DN3161_c0_g1_i1.p1  ORF type:complete len:547 (+),score=177.95 TRINITY_DN3161_c0_g1_i1:95-1735(+)